MSSDRVLARFLNGPLAGKGNIANAGGGYDYILPRSVYGWPLPDRMAALCPPGTTHVAMWNPDDPGDLPPVIVNSANAVIYRKVAESPITDDEAADMSHVIRGAQYELERP